jgi:hypothetical protein
MRQIDGTSFTWSLAKIRIASLVLVGTAMPTVAGFVISVPFLKELCLAWLFGVAALMHVLSRRVSSDPVVLSVDHHGILDRRLTSRYIEWREIQSVFPVNADRNHTVDIELRWPKRTLRDTRWPVRIGAYCQEGYGVPAVTISMLLLEGNVSEMLDAVRRYRPDLLHHTNRVAQLTGQ